MLPFILIDLIIYFQDGKLRAMLTDQNAIMRQEFDKIRSEMELVSQNQNENLVSKMITLKKTILKLQKSKDKLAYDYEKKINHILKVIIFTINMIL